MKTRESYSNCFYSINLTYLWRPRHVQSAEMGSTKRPMQPLTSNSFVQSRLVPSEGPIGEMEQDTFLVNSKCKHPFLFFGPVLTSQDENDVMV